MAKGQRIGLLNFEIGGDDSELKKILDARQKQAISLEKTLANLGVGKAPSTAETLRLLKQEAKIVSDMEMQQERLNTQKARTAQIEKRTAQIGVDAQNRLRESVGLTNKSFLSQNAILRQLSVAAGTYVSIWQAGRFVRELAMVSGEFEKQRLALATILQDTEAAEKIFNQIKELAAISPFKFKELTDYAKQLSAFSIPTDELFETTKRLADISSGLGVDMSRIILAYGQVRSAAVLRGQELRQFTEAGIPLVAELAKRFSELEGEVVSVGEVFERISNRMVPFQMVKDIFEDLTSEGGKFYNMQEIQAQSLAGKITNLRDAYDIMLDSIGQANQGLLKGSVQGLTDMMENWEKYWNILKSIIVAYGTYKGIVIATNLAMKSGVIIETIQRFIQLTKVVRTSTAALAALSAIGLTTPLTAIATAIGVIVGGLILFSQKAKTTEEIIDGLSNSTEAYSKSIDENENRILRLTNTYEELKSKTNLSETEQNKLYNTIGELVKIVPQAANEFDKYGNAIGLNVDKIKQFNEEQQKFVKQGLAVEIKQGEARIKEIQEQQKTLSDKLAMVGCLRVSILQRLVVDQQHKWLVFLLRKKTKPHYN